MEGEEDLSQSEVNYVVDQSITSATGTNEVENLISEGVEASNSYSSTGQEDEALDELIETYFADGPLGVTLRRRVDTGIVFIHDIIAKSQAEHIDVKSGDELWAISDSEIGETPLDKEAWNGLITFIKQSPRPLRMVWRRRTRGAKTVVADPQVDPNRSTSANNSLLELQKLASRLIFREKEAPINPFLNFVVGSTHSNTSHRPMFDAENLVQEGRRILRQGQLHLCTNKGSIWSKSAALAQKRAILLSDLFLVTSAHSGNMFMVEHVIDLHTCKLRSVGGGFGGDSTTSGESNIQITNPDHITDVGFEIIWPGGELQLLAENRELKEVWVLNIYLAICDCIGEDERSFGWRHQYMLGTMHSAVLHRDEERVKELIAMCEAGLMDYASIDSRDEDGYTPLHYACILRMHGMVRLLHDATADVNVGDSMGLTPLHWAAMQVDEHSLSILCSHIFDVDIEDRLGRTPLVVACVEGRDISGRSDMMALKNVLECLLNHKPNLLWTDALGQSLLHYLAASWQAEPLSLLLKAGYGDVNVTESRGNMTPLHQCCAAKSLKLAIGEGMRITGIGMRHNGVDNDAGAASMTEPLNNLWAVDTIKVLVRGGAKVNVKDSLGRTPLAILLDTEQTERWEMEELQKAIGYLISCGAKLDENTSNIIKQRHPDISLPPLVEKWTSSPVIDCNALDVKLNQFELLPLVEKEGSLDVGSSAAAPTAASSKAESKSCQLCGLQFTMFRRAHHCRLCNVICCDDCSKRRCLIDNAQLRTCDCCYNRASDLLESRRMQEMLKSIKPIPHPTSWSESEQRDQLFAGSAINIADPVSRKNNTNVETTSKVATTMATMNEMHDRLVERGEKLSQVQDKTAELANQANEFANLARQLREQQKNRWF